MSNQEVIQILRDQGLNVFECVGKTPMMKAWQNEIFTGEITTENFGVRMGDSNTICIDVDDIALLPHFEFLKDRTYMVETGKGFHVYIKVKEYGKIQRLDNDQGQHIDIQSTGSYVIGESSLHESGKYYKLLSKDRTINEIPFEDVKDILENLGFDKGTKEANYKMRQRFLKGIIPAEKTSNRFYFNAGIQCLTDGLSRDEATKKIKLNYDEWINSTAFSGREWSNVETAINKVYDDPDKWALKHGGQNKAKDSTEWKNELFAGRKIFSDIHTKTIYENRDGFPKPINDELHKELVRWDNDLTQKSFNTIIFQILGQAQDVPEKDNDRIVFSNGTFRHSTGKSEDTDLDKLAYLGFEDLDYIENPKCPKFLDVMFSGIPKKQHPQIKAGLKSIFQPKLDSRISVIHGLSGSGKSTGLSIIGLLLGDNAMMIRPSTFASQPFIQAKIKDKLLVVFLDMPEDFDSYMNLMKTFTGESNQTVRGFHQDAELNLKVIAKFWGATNNLFSVPFNEKDPMFNRRLSLMTKDIPETPYPEDSDYAEIVAKEEGSDIVSWILNLTDEECQYEPKEVVQPLWESISDPVRKWIEENFEENSISDQISIVKLIKEFVSETKSNTNAIFMEKLLKEIGYPVRSGIISRLKRKKVEKPQNKQGGLF